MAIAAPTISPEGLMNPGTLNYSGNGISGHGMLEIIFGSIAQDPLAALTSFSGGDTVVSLVFMYINVGLLMLGSIYLTYKTLAAVTQTANDGDFMGKAFHTVWVPIRVTMGVLSLTPIAGGWNALQVVMLWIGVMGAGLADITWKAVVNGWTGDVQAQHAALAKPNIATAVRFGNGATLAEKAYKGLICDEYFVFMNTRNGIGPDTTNGYQDHSGVTDSRAVYRGYFDNSGFNCGGYSVSYSSSPLSANGNGTGKGLNTLSLQISKQAYNLTDAMVKEIRPIAASTVAKLMANLDEAAGLTSTGVTTLPDLRPEVAQVGVVGASYQAKLTETINALINTASAQDGTAPIVQASAKEFGFVTAGQFYTAYANSSYKVNANKGGDGAVNITYDEDLVRTKSAESGFYDYMQTYLYAAHTAVTPSQGSKTEGTSASAAFDLLQEKMGFGDMMVSAFVTNDATAPALVNIKNTADNIVVFAEVAITAGGAIKGVAESAVGWLAKLTPVGGAIIGAVGPWIDMFIFVAQMALGFFLMCSIYLPMVPYIVFIGQVLEWVASVMLGVSAAPFLAFAHFDTDGEGLGQRTQYGYTFMLQSFMRPILLILGFIMASAMIEVSIYFLTTTFSFAVADAQVHSITGLFSILGFIALYMILAVGMVNTSCSLMYLIPDAIFRFIGADTVGMGFGRDTGHNAQNSALGGAGASRALSGKGIQSKDDKDRAAADATHAGQQREMEAANYDKFKAGQAGNGASGGNDG